MSHLDPVDRDIFFLGVALFVFVTYIIARFGPPW
jgi:hypothetical protein